MTTRQYRTFLTLISYTSLVYADESIIQPRGVGLDYNVQLGRLRLENVPKMGTQKGPVGARRGPAGARNT